MMSEECITACPAMKTFLEEMMKPPEGEMTDEEKEAAGAKMMCDNMDAVVCMSSEAACQDPMPEGEEAPTEQEEKDGMDMFKCSCACQSEFKMLEDPKTMCPNKAKVVGCLTDNSFCAPVVKMLGGTRSADITCEMLDANCEELGEKLGTCVGEEKWGTFGGDCSTAAVEKKLADHKDKCCPLLTEVMGCYNKKCVTLSWEQQEIMMDNMEAGDEKTEMAKAVEGNYQWGSVCTDSGLPSSKTALMASPTATAAADDASQALPALSMAAILIAASF